MPTFRVGSEEQSWSFKEIPPRVRRRAGSALGSPHDGGNTSACAEKSNAGWGVVAPCGKYLRVCGEEPYCLSRPGRPREIPPRVRRRGESKDLNQRRRRNTSACAEKSWRPGMPHQQTRKYLRVCGEEENMCTLSVPYLEIPPRVRRRVRARGWQNKARGNTSACAEKSIR